MSDNWLRYIPSEPNFQPTLSAAEKAQLLLASFALRADQVRFEFTADVRFIDPGSNWTTGKCSACGPDAQSWWKNAMSALYKAKFSNLEVIAPCCGARVSLNDLDYVWPAGFARFVIEAKNPGLKNLTEEQER